jgi:GT2 family glycosyltransferase
MPIHHFLSRATLLVLVLWASGGVFAFSYATSRWSRHHHARDIRPAHAPASEVRCAAPLAFFHTPVTGLVSVVIPTYNRAGNIARAVQSALAQTYPKLEVVVADDGSTDDTAAVVRTLGSRVTYVRQANAGVSAARNFGMLHARGEFIAFLDSDDAWETWKIAAQMEALRRHPDAGVVWTDMAAINEEDQIVAPRYIRRMYSAYQDVDIAETLRKVDMLAGLQQPTPAEFGWAGVYKGDVSSAILLGNLIHTSTVLFRRSWCQRTGGFDESYERAGEDYEFYIRLTSAGPAVFIDAPSTLYRVGVADQLTAPSMMLEIARNNLRAIQTWLHEGDESPLPEDVVRRRFAESFAWLGGAELDAGHPALAARDLSRSLAMVPALDKRALLLASCILPPGTRESLHSLKRSLRSGSDSTRNPHASA